ncbi:MAG TPA: DUF4440 domain-containing protein [Bryobacteraceae bacterium]|jgi:ketosteroid isomerase-like protein
MLRAFSLLCLAAIVCAAGDQPSPEAAVRRAEEAWATAIASRSLEQTIQSYDADGFNTGSAMPPARGLAAIRAVWDDIFNHPDFSLTWKPESITVSESGTTACSSGTWRMTGPDGSGYYLAVWRKQPDGKWKILIGGAWHTRTE